MPVESALRVLVLADAACEAELLRALRDAGHAPLVPATRHTMVQRVKDDAPDVVVCHVRDVDTSLFDALAQACALSACAVFTADHGDAALERALECGVHAWVVDGYTQQRLDAVLRLARARARRDARTRAELMKSREQLDERKWVERAKGVLMNARQIGEDDAFKLLRGASMHAQLRVGQLSRAVIEAAQRADAVNRAGQLRMLSQRLLKLLMQRAAGVEVRQATALLEQSRERVQATLMHLHGLSDTLGARDELAATEAAWQALAPLLVPRGKRAGMTRADALAADAAADALLAAAERLTTAIEAGSGVRSVQIVNLCGRQRMRAQRIVKQVLFATWADAPRDDDAAPRAIEREIAEFEHALAELERAPLTAPDIRAGLLAAREEWLRLLRGVQDAATADGRTAMAHSSERLLDHFEALTAAYEKSLQVIMNG
jgi:AmiR/NasT family two-component response regulator